jgi:glucose-6-phosphate isomerase
MIPETLTAIVDLERGIIEGAPQTVRHLADLKECFADSAAYSAALAEGNPEIYRVSSVEPASGDGQMHYGLGVLMPGKIGNEYYMTKGHYHSWRPAAEVYIGLSGEGFMLLQDEATGESRLERLAEGTIVYVPGHTAHRTINSGSEPLKYLGVYPSSAGHDYAPIAEKNFNMMLVDEAGTPKLIERLS